jgi:O-antigen biosynthesis protein
LFSRIVRTAALALAPSRLPTTIRTIRAWIQLRRDSEALATWEQFYSADEYLCLHPDVANWAVAPTIHFLLCSSAELRDPSREFDTRYYLGRYPDVARSGINPLLHYALVGKREGRTIKRRPPAQTFDTSAAEMRFPIAANLPILPINNDWRSDYPLVSVVIPVFNNAVYLEEGIRSILNQTYQDLELIVVEGGSTDAATVKKVRELEALGLPKTRFFYRSERHHVGDNKNFGTSMARGRYVCCLDQDDMLGQVYLEVAVFLAEVFGYELIYPSLRAFGKPGTRWAYGDANLRWLVLDPSFPEILSENQVPNSAMFTRSSWAHVGGYRDFGTFEDFVQEDWDFWIRLLGHGFRAISIRELLHLYRVLESGMTATYKPDLNRQRERLRLVNAALTDTWRPSQEIRRTVLNSYANLGPVDDKRTSVLLGLPALMDESTRERFRTQGESIFARGERLLVVTSLTPEEAMAENAWQVPDPDGRFDGITRHVYRLSWLFHDETHCREFLRYLIGRYRVHTVILAGCEVLERMLPGLQPAFPEIVFTDQRFAQQTN